MSFFISQTLRNSLETAILLDKPDKLPQLKIQVAQTNHFGHILETCGKILLFSFNPFYKTSEPFTTTPTRIQTLLSPSLLLLWSKPLLKLSPHWPPSIYTCPLPYPFPQSFFNTMVWVTLLTASQIALSQARFKDAPKISACWSIISYPKIWAETGNTIWYHPGK